MSRRFRELFFVSWAKHRGVKVSPSVSELQADGLDNYLMPEEDRHADYHMTRHYDGMKRPWSWPQGRDTLRRRWKRTDYHMTVVMRERSERFFDIGQSFFPRVVLEGCFRTPLRSNSDSVRWKNVTAFTVLDRRRPIKAATSIGPQSCVSQTSDSWVILFKRLFEVNRFDGTDKDFESQNTCGFFSCSFDY